MREEYKPRIFNKRLRKITNILGRKSEIFMKFEDFLWFLTNYSKTITFWNFNISATIWIFLIRFFLNIIHSSRYVHFRGVFYSADTFWYCFWYVFKICRILYFFVQVIFYFFGKCLRGSSKNYPILKNSPEMNVSQRVHDV